LGGYSTHWVPSLRLDQLCDMLWDMIRYKNFDVDSPYNREAAQWARIDETYQFPLDHRPLRDKTAVISQKQAEPAEALELSTLEEVPSPPKPKPMRYPTEGFIRPVPEASPEELEILFMDDEIEIVDAELVPGWAEATEEPDILFID